MFVKRMSLAAMAMVALGACADDGAMSPADEVTPDFQVAGRQGPRHGMSRLVAAIREQGDAEAVALLNDALEARDAARAARESGDREVLRAQMREFREGMHAAVVRTFPDRERRVANGRFRRGDRSMEGGDVSARRGQLLDNLAPYVEVETLQLIRDAMDAARAARESGDIEAARSEMHELRSMLRATISSLTDEQRQELRSSAGFGHGALDGERGPVHFRRRLDQ